MNSDGYLVIRNCIKPRLYKAALKAAEEMDETDWVSIFKKLKPRIMDPYRHQHEIEVSDLHKWPFVSEISTKVMKIAKEIQPQWEISRPWVFLRSLPEGETQSLHRDFPEKDIPSYEDYPGVLMVAIQNGTKLSVFGWNKIYAFRDEEVVVELDAGDVIIFRGDLIHRGMAYDETHFRLHCHLDLIGAKPTKDRVRPAHFATYSCDKCTGTRFETKAELTGHSSSCIQCAPCGTEFTERGTFLRHNSRKHHPLPASKQGLGGNKKQKKQ